MKELHIIKQKKNIKVFLNNSMLTVQGPLGELSQKIKITNFNNLLFVSSEQLELLIKIIKKLIKSVTYGWFIELNLNGIGYKSFKFNDKIALDLGYSNLVLYKSKSNLKIKNFKNKLVLFSIDKDYLYNVAYRLRNYSFPDAYKGKGILFRNQILKLKKKVKS